MDILILKSYLLFVMCVIFLYALRHFLFTLNRSFGERFSWTIIGFFNKLSSFLLYFTPGEIAAVFAYMMAFALLESLAVTGILVLISAVLPGGWLRDGFGYKGFIILVIAAINFILLQRSLQNVFPSVLSLALFTLVPIALSAVLILFVRSRPKAQKLLVSVQDRFLLILFVYLPASVLFPSPRSWSEIFFKGEIAMQGSRGLTRREFLKLISLAPVGIYSRPLSKVAAMEYSASPNIIIIVFDAWSHRDVPLYGYPRRTSPNVDRFAENATVYHNHYSTGSYPVPSTSTIFTGMHPWTHRLAIPYPLSPVHSAAASRFSLPASSAPR